MTCDAYRTDIRRFPTLDRSPVIVRVKEKKRFGNRLLNYAFRNIYRTSDVLLAVPNYTTTVCPKQTSYYLVAPFFSSRLATIISLVLLPKAEKRRNSACPSPQQRHSCLNSTRLRGMRVETLDYVKSLLTACC